MQDLCNLLCYYDLHTYYKIKNNLYFERILNQKLQLSTLTPSAICHQAPF